MIYKITAYWPNSRTDPLVKRVAHLAEALDVALDLMAGKQYMTISVTTPDGLELIRLWGQPPFEGEWP